jgi:hypothetical protein
MAYRWLADAVVVAHLLFVAFAVAGGLLVARWPWAAAAHLPAVAWAAWVEFSGAICPLTPVENRLRALGGEAGYPGGFVDHYLLPVLYPAALDRELQWTLGAILLAANAAAYGWAVRRRRARRLLRRPPGTRSLR